MNIVAQDLHFRVALCGHEYRVPQGMRGRARKYCDPCAPALKVSPLRANDTPDGMRPCSGCSEFFKIGPRDRNPRKWCSEYCRISAHALRSPEYRERIAKRSAERYRESYVKPSYELTCTVCDEGFNSGRPDRLYCSKVCSNKAYAARRRADGRAADMSAKRKALELGVKIQAGRRLAVLESDNWICHLCEAPTNRDAVYPADDYPVIDHVVPLSKGGDHAPSNWKTAHSLCNMRKGDLSLEEFWERFPIKEVA